MGKRLHRELQLEASRRATQRRDLLLAQGSPHPHRGLATALQHHPAALGPRIQATCSRGGAVAGCATPTSSAGHTNRGVTPDHALTFNLDHLMGAGHVRSCHLPSRVTAKSGAKITRSMISALPSK